MELFWKTAAAVLLAMILGLTLQKQDKDLQILLWLGVCCMAGMAAMWFLEPVVHFLLDLGTAANLDRELMQTLMKITGIALIAELISMLCLDAGSSSLGKGLQLAASSAILYLSVPVFESVMSVVMEILGEL